MGRRRVYATATERQRAHRQRQQGQASDTTRRIALMEAHAQEHIVVCMGLLQVQKQATAEQRQLQEALKDRDMMDALWMLQTLIADFGYAEVERCVLQHLRPLQSPPSPLCQDIENKPTPASSISS